MPPFARGVSCQNDRSPLLGFGTSLTARAPRRLSSFDDGYQVPATEGPRGCHLGVERSHQSHGYRKGTLDYHTGQGSFWPRQRHPHNAQSEFLLVPVDRSQAEMHLGLDDR